jgi:hypothetical protein
MENEKNSLISTASATSSISTIASKPARKNNNIGNGKFEESFQKVIIIIHLFFFKNDIKISFKHFLGPMFSQLEEAVGKNKLALDELEE